MKRKGELPPWSPKSGEQTRWFIEWTIQRWYDLHDPPDADEAARDVALSDPAQAAKLTRTLWPEGPLLAAIAGHDEAKFVRLMRDAQQARFAFRLLTKPKRKVGRPRQAGPEPYWPLEIVSEIEYIWNRHYKKWQRGRNNPPTVYEIAEMILAREGLNIEAYVVQEYRRKHGKP
jgi:hypothetical protein